MKYLLLLALAISNLVAMNSTEKNISFDELTTAEKNCYDWFAQQKKEFSSSYQKLSPEDIDVFNKQLRYTDHPEAVTRSRNNLVEIFYSQLEEVHVKPEYDKDMLKCTVLKMTKAMHNKSIETPTDLLSARMYVFSKMLTAQEQLTWSQENYLKNPQEAQKVVLKWSNLVAQEIAKLKLIENTEMAKNKKSQELYEEKIALLKKTYIK